MITFAYQARDASGRIVSGIQDALNEDNAVTSLMSRGLMVLSLQKKSVASKSRKKIWTVKETDLVLFTRQLATMIDAGISLFQRFRRQAPGSNPVPDRRLRFCPERVVFSCGRNWFADFRDPNLSAFHAWQATGRSLETEAAGVRSARAQDLHVALRTHVRPAYPQRRPDFGSARYRRRNGRESRHRDQHQICERRCRKRRQPLCRAVEEIDFPAHATANGLGG